MDWTGYAINILAAIAILCAGLWGSGRVGNMIRHLGMKYPQLDVILDGRLGMIFLQRPLSEEEIDVLLDKGHSPILRRDFLRRAPLTEDDVLEIDMRKSSR